MRSLTFDCLSHLAHDSTQNIRNVYSLNQSRTELLPTEQKHFMYGSKLILRRFLCEIELSVQMFAQWSLKRFLNHRHTIPLTIFFIQSPNRKSNRDENHKTLDSTVGAVN